MLPISLIISLVLLTQGGAANAADEFWTRKVIESCKASEEVKNCMSDVFDKLEATEKAIENSREFLKDNLKISDIPDELDRLHKNLDKKAGYESIITHLLREDCNEDVETGWDEQSCKDDPNYIPEFDRSMIEVYKSAIKEYLTPINLPIGQEKRTANVLFLLGKLENEFRRQEDERDRIKAGFWLTARYAQRRSAANNLAASMLTDDAITQ